MSDPLLEFTSAAFVFLMAEAVEWVVLVHDDAGWHYRFGEVEEYPNLNPIISTFVVAVIVFVIFLIITPFLLPQVWQGYVVGVVESTLDWYLLSVLGVVFSFLWIWHNIVGKDWNAGQYALALISALILIVYLYANVAA